jgi:hypothetical protein
LKLLTIDTFITVPPKREIGVTDGHMETEAGQPEMRVVTRKIAIVLPQIVVNNCDTVIIAIIGQERRLQYAILLSTDIKQRISAHVIAAELKLRITTAAVIFPKRVAESKAPTCITGKTIVVVTAET